MAAVLTAGPHVVVRLQAVKAVVVILPVVIAALLEGLLARRCVDEILQMVAIVDLLAVIPLVVTETQTTIAETLPAAEIPSVVTIAHPVVNHLLGGRPRALTAIDLLVVDRLADPALDPFAGASDLLSGTATGRLRVTTADLLGDLHRVVKARAKAICVGLAAAA